MRSNDSKSKQRRAACGSGVMRRGAAWASRAAGHSWRAMAGGGGGADEWARHGARGAPAPGRGNDRQKRPAATLSERRTREASGARPLGSGARPAQSSGIAWRAAGASAGAGEAPPSGRPRGWGVGGAKWSCGPCPRVRPHRVGPAGTSRLVLLPPVCKPDDQPPAPCLLDQGGGVRAVQRGDGSGGGRDGIKLDKGLLAAAAGLLADEEPD